MAHPDANDLGISNEIRTDAPLIGHGNERNQMGRWGFRGLKKS